MDILNQANIFYFSIKTAMNSFFLFGILDKKEDYKFIQ